MNYILVQFFLSNGVGSGYGFDDGSGLGYLHECGISNGNGFGGFPNNAGEAPLFSGYGDGEGYGFGDGNGSG